MDAKKQKQDEMLRRIEEMREQRKAKERARIDKLRSMNLQKYKTEEDRQSLFTGRMSIVPNRPKNFSSMTDQRKSFIPRPIDAKSPITKEIKNKTVTCDAIKKDTTKMTVEKSKDIKKTEPAKLFDSRKSILGNVTAKDIARIVSNIKLPVTTKTNETSTKTQARKSIAPKAAPVATVKKIVPQKTLPRASIKPIPKVMVEKRKDIQMKKNTEGTPRLSVFERLYNCRNKTTRKETIFEQKNRLVSSHANCAVPIEVVKENVHKMRRSISAVHFKRIGKNELKNCFHRYSVGDGLNKLDLEKIDDGTESQIVNTIRSERKKVKFHIGTPKPDELEQRLKNWLQKRGKSVDSYHHLRCFGVHLAPALQFDDENKENIAVDISDDGSFDELTIGEDSKMTWRRASLNDSEIFTGCTPNESDKSMNSAMTPVPKAKVDEILLSALTDLSQLVREGYDWEQCARWLRAIRDKCPNAPSLAAYWECRAALEEFRGNLPRSWMCWEEAISKGTETSVAEASIDLLLDKFMQLNISPTTGAPPSPSRKQLMSAKSVFKTSLIRFAVQNAKAKTDATKYTVTPVRRSSRIKPITTPASGRTPLLQLASSLKMIDEDIRDKALFIPNKLLQYSP